MREITDKEKAQLEDWAKKVAKGRGIIIVDCPHCKNLSIVFQENTVLAVPDTILANQELPP